MTTIKIPLLLILFFCIAVPAFAADTVRTYDTVVHYDTTYLYDTTLAVQRQLSEMKSEFYDKAIQSLDDKRSNVNIMLIIIAIFIALIAIVVGYMTYLMQRSREEADREGREMRERRSAIDKVYDDVMMRERRLKQSMAKIDEMTAKAVAPLETEEVKEKRLAPEERIKLISEADAEESIEEYEKLLFAMELEGVSKDKLPTSLHKNVGLNYYRLDRYEKAVEEFLLYLDAFPNDKNCLFNVAYCYGQLKNHDRAVHFYSRVTQLNPKDDIAYSNWAYGLLRLYDERKNVSLLQQAIDLCRKAINVNDKNYGAYHNWGVALSKLYNERKDVSLFEEAIAKYKKAIEINENADGVYSDWGWTLGELYYDERKDVSLLGEAFEKYKKAIQINCKNAIAYYNLAALLLKKWRRKLDDTGKSDETLLKDARAHALKALEIAPERKEYNYNLACAESLLENKTEMLKALEIAIEYDTKHKKKAREDKDFEKYRGDPDFIALTKED